METEALDGWLVSRDEPPRGELKDLSSPCNDYHETRPIAREGMADYSVG
jgi:hypothetical protein